MAKKVYEPVGRRTTTFYKERKSSSVWGGVIFCVIAFVVIGAIAG